MTGVDTTVEDLELLAIKRRKVALLTAKNEALKKDSLPFYRPHAKQVLFHASSAKRRGAFTANRFGKTLMGVAECCSWLRGERPFFKQTFDVQGRRQDKNGKWETFVSHRHEGHDAHPLVTQGIPQRPVKGLVIIQDWDKAKELWTGTDGKIWKFLVKGSYHVTRNHSGAVDTIFVKNRFGVSSLRFDTVKSFMSNPMGSESSDWDFIDGDEPFPEAMWKAQSRGLVDRNGFAWFTLTALREPWITSAFEPEGNFYDAAGRDCFVMDGSIYDNPYLPPEAIDSFERDLTPDERECRLYGKPFHKVGLIYKEFQRHKHVLTKVPDGWEAFDRPPKTWPIYFQLDPHPQTPCCFLFYTVDPFGRRYYFKDIFLHDSIEELAKVFHATTAGLWVVRGHADPLAFIEDPLRKMPTMVEEFARNGIHFNKAPKALAHGILKVQGELKKEPPVLFFCPTAKRTIWEIGRYHWDEGEDKPVDKDDHAMECLYRAELDQPVWMEQTNNLRPIEDEQFGHTRFSLTDLEFANN